MSDTFELTVPTQGYKLILLSPGGYGEASASQWHGTVEDYAKINPEHTIRELMRSLSAKEN